MSVYQVSKSTGHLSFGQANPTLRTGTSGLDFKEEIDTFVKTLKPIKPKPLVYKLIAPFRGVLKWLNELFSGTYEFVRILLKTPK